MKINFQGCAKRAKRPGTCFFTAVGFAGNVVSPAICFAGTGSIRFFMRFNAHLCCMSPPAAGKVFLSHVVQGHRNTYTSL